MASPHGPVSNEVLAAIWRARLAKAKAAYDLALAEFHRSAEEFRCKESDELCADRSLREAIAAEAAAREHYVTVLQAFTDLIVNGKTPPEN